MSHSTTTQFRPSLLFKVSEGETICFKYSGGSWPGVPRTLFFHSWYIAGPERRAYMKAYDSNGNFKTFHCSKISEFSSSSQSKSSPASTSPKYEAPKMKKSSSQSTSVNEEMSENNFSNWTSWIKKNDIIQFSYSNEAEIRNVTFVAFMNRQCSTKRKILAYQNGYTKTFFIDKMKVHKIFEVDEQYNKKNDTDSDFEDYSQTDTVEDDEMSISSSESFSSPQELHNEIKHLESKQELLCKEMKAHIDSQNIIIEELKKKCYDREEECSELNEECSTLEDDCCALQEDYSALQEEHSTLQKKCYKLEDEIQNLYSIMNTHKTLYPLTWVDDFEPKKPDGWEVITPPTPKK